jgi:serine/threonine protein phosphatase PrpC
LVLASDGVWEFMSNEDVARISRDPFYFKSAPEAAANALVKEAYKRWKIVSFISLTVLKEEEVIDDITCVVVYFDEGLISSSLRAHAATKEPVSSSGSYNVQKPNNLVLPTY